MGFKLLLADDSITIQKVVGIIFASEEYDLTVVDNGATALEKARQDLPDAMLVDALMPGKTGYEVCQEVRRDPHLQKVPILLMTGAFEPFDEEKARQCGADGYIAKPFESQQLVDSVKRLIEVGRGRQPAAPVVAAVPDVPAAPPLTSVPEPPPLVAAVPPLVAAEPLVAALPVVEPPPAPFVELAAPQPEPEVVEGMPEDDLWGVFDLEEEEEESFAAEEEAAAGIEVEQAFTFAEEEGVGVVEPPPATPAAGPSFAPQWEPVGEHAFTYETQPTSDAVQHSLAEPAGETESIPPEALDFFAEPEGQVGTVSGFAEVQPLASLSSEPAKQMFAREEEAAPAPAGAVPASLSEEQLKALLAGISREVIERIVWEVVPDLAETLIREEIRKIKEGK